MYSKKKILITASTFPNFSEIDSEPTFIYELAKRLSEKKDLKIIVSTPYVEGSKVYEERDNITIYRFKYGFTALCRGSILSNIKKNKLLLFQVPFFILLSLLNLIKLTKIEKINIIHAHWIIPQSFIAVFYKNILRKNNLKIICTIHGSDIFKLRNWLMTKLKKWTLDNVDAITVVSREIEDEVKKIRVKKPRVDIAPMGVDENLFNKNKYDENIKNKYHIKGIFLLSVGRLDEKKGFQYVISAMPMVLEKYPTAKLLIVGEGNFKGTLLKQIKKLGIENNVILTGGIPNSELPEYYATADLFLGSSESEGFGLVFVEALLSKCCVISSELRSVSEIVKNEDTGLQVNVRDSRLFADKIIELAGNDIKRKRLAESGYDHVRKNYTWNISIEKYYKLLKDI